MSRVDLPAVAGLLGHTMLPMVTHQRQHQLSAVDRFVKDKIKGTLRRTPAISGQRRLAGKRIANYRKEVP
jgi:hypothetical protein